MRGKTRKTATLSPQFLQYQGEFPGGGYDGGGGSRGAPLLPGSGIFYKSDDQSGAVS